MFGDRLRIERSYVKALSRLLLKPDDPEFTSKAKMLALRLVMRLAYENARSWRLVAETPRLRRQIRETFRDPSGPVSMAAWRLTNENVRMIHWFTEQPRVPVYLAVRNMIIKAESDLTQAMAEGLGLSWYIWQTREDVRVRQSHRRMNRILVNWHDPPNPENLLGITSGLGHYNAGRAPGCRCVPIPVVSLSDLSWPHRVYFNGVVRYLTRAQFRHLTGPHPLH